MDTRKRIQTAIIELLEENRMEELTVKEIAYQAGVGRRTFYSYFNSIEECVSSCLGDAGEELRADLESLPLPSHENVARVLFAHWQKYRVMFHRINTRTNIDLYRGFQRLIGLLEDAAGRDSSKTGLNESGYMDSFAAGGLFSIFLRWVNDENPPDKNKMARFLGEFVALMDRAITESED